MEGIALIYAILFLGKLLLFILMSILEKMKNEITSKAEEQSWYCAERKEEI